MIRKIYRRYFIHKNVICLILLTESPDKVIVFINSTILKISKDERSNKSFNIQKVKHQNKTLFSLVAILLRMN